MHGYNYFNTYEVVKNIGGTVMKKKLVYGIVLCMMLFLVACDNSKKDVSQEYKVTDTPVQKETSTSAPEPTEEQTSTEAPTVKPDENAGLYDESGNKIETWENLISSGKVAVDGNKLTKVDTSLVGVLKISNTIQIIGEKACYQCSKLTGVTIPDSVTTIEKVAFAFCTGLTSIVIPDSVTSMGSSAFSNCTKMTSITLSNSLTAIPNSAFYNCNKVTEIVIPEGVTSIGRMAFNCCAGLKSMTIPASVTSIESGAFGGAFYKDYVYVKEGSYAEKYIKENHTDSAYIKYY